MGVRKSVNFRKLSEESCKARTKIPQFVLMVGGLMQKYTKFTFIHIYLTLLLLSTDIFIHIQQLSVFSRNIHIHS